MPLPNGIFLPASGWAQLPSGLPWPSVPPQSSWRSSPLDRPETEAQGMNRLLLLTLCPCPLPAPPLPHRVGENWPQKAHAGEGAADGAAGQGVSGEGGWESLKGLLSAGRGVSLPRPANQQCSQVRWGGGQPGGRVPHRDMPTRPLAAPALAPPGPAGSKSRYLQPHVSAGPQPERVLGEQGASRWVRTPLDQPTPCQRARSPDSASTPSVQRPGNQMSAEAAIPKGTHLQSTAIFHVLWAILKQVCKTGILIDDILAYVVCVCVLAHTWVGASLVGAIAAAAS